MAGVENRYNRPGTRADPLEPLDYWLLPFVVAGASDMDRPFQSTTPCATHQDPPGFPCECECEKEEKNLGEGTLIRTLSEIDPDRTQLSK